MISSNATLALIILKSDIDRFIVHLCAMFSPNQINESKTKIHMTKFMNNHGLANNMKVPVLYP